MSEIIWAVSTTGEEFQCVHADDYLDPKARTEWQPIETAPKDGTVFLGADLGAQTVFIFTSHWVIHRDYHGDVTEEYWSNGPTHWMPCPEPPK